MPRVQLPIDLRVQAARDQRLADDPASRDPSWYDPRRVVKRFAVLVALGLGTILASATAAPQPGSRLVLLIAIDQFRYDYLTRFRAEFKDGFDRLLTQGAVFSDANLEHYPTVTAIGHATMLSGATPAVSGIIGNDWFDRESGRTITSVSDERVKPLGATTGEPASPHRLLVTTIGDEIKLASRLPNGSP